MKVNSSTKIKDVIARRIMEVYGLTESAVRYLTIDSAIRCQYLDQDWDEIEKRPRYRWIDDLEKGFKVSIGNRHFCAELQPNCGGELNVIVSETDKFIPWSWGMGLSFRYYPTAHLCPIRNNPQTIGDLFPRTKWKDMTYAAMSFMGLSD